MYIQKDCKVTSKYRKGRNRMYCLGYAVKEMEREY